MLGVATRTFSEPSGTVLWLTDGAEPGVELPHAVFDEAYVAVDAETGTLVTTEQTVLGVRLSDLPNQPKANRDQVKARGQLYRVSDVQRDGVAGAIIFLKWLGPAA